MSRYKRSKPPKVLVSVIQLVVVGILILYAVTIIAVADWIINDDKTPDKNHPNKDKMPPDTKTLVQASVVSTGLFLTALCHLNSYYYFWELRHKNGSYY